MESSLEFEIVRIRSKERMRRNAIGPDDLKYLPGRREEEDEDEEYEKENSAPCLRDKTKTRLQRLGVLYGDGEVSSPIHRSEEHFVAELSEDGRTNGPVNDKYSEQRSKRFRALASTINSWEDDIRHISPKKEEPEKFDRFGNKVGARAVRHDVVQPAAGRGVPPQSPSPQKKVAWDRRIINTLESQGFKRCDSEEHLVYDYISPESKECTSPRKAPGRRDPLPSGSPPRKAPGRRDPPPSASPPRKAVDCPKSAFIASRQTPFLGGQTQEERPAKKFTPTTPQAPRKVLEEIPLRKVDEAREIFQERKTKNLKDVNQKTGGGVLKYPNHGGSRSVSPQRPLSPQRSLSPVRRPQSPTKPTSPVRRPPSPQKSAVLEMAAQFEVNSGPPKPARSLKDPALLSVAEKRAVFEKNTGFVPIPQAPLTQAPVPPQAGPHRDRSPVRRQFPPPDQVATPSAEERSPVRHNVNQAVIDRFREIEALRHRWDRNKAVSTMEEVLENRTPVQNRPPPPEPMEVTVSPQPVPAPPPLPHHLLSPPSTASTPGPLPRPAFTPSPSPGGVRMGTRSPVRRDKPDSPPKRQLPRVLSIKEKSPITRDCGYPDVKKIRVSPPKQGHIYPSISDIETESEVPESDLEPIEEEGSEPEDGPGNTSLGFSSELDSSMGSLGQQIVRQASRTNLKRPSQQRVDTSDHESGSSFSETESRVLREMDDLLEEAMSGMPSPPKRSRDSPSSSELNFETCSTASFEYSSSDCARPKPTPTTPLLHTVSVYRKQQHLSTTPTIRREVRTSEEYKPSSTEAISSDSTPEEELVLDRIKELQTEIGKQLETISQASKALNLCHSTPGFSGSTAELEAQKLLLIANARWNAMNQEVDRLKVERRLKPGLPGRTERGDISLSKVALPLKAFQSSGAHSSVLVLVKSGPVVLATEVLTLDKKTIRDSRIHFEKVVTLKGLYSDFAASIEVYGYSPKKVEFACPDLKSHTPKKEKSKKKDKSGFFPVESPAGPNVVRTSAFQLWGYAVFSLREVNRNSFTLNKVPYTCPLEGTLEVSMSSSMQSQVEHVGFLTVYEDVSGFGAWKRRWAVLRGTSVAFWAYPDQYKEGKVALDTLDLSSVTSDEAALAPRELCARPHTILLQARVSDVSIPESLVARRENGATVLTYLLSADTKEERLQWCEQLNKVLHLLRAWKVTRT